MKSITLVSLLALAAAALPVAAGCTAESTPDEDVDTAESALKRTDVETADPKDPFDKDVGAKGTGKPERTPIPDGQAIEMKGKLTRIFVGRSRSGKGKVGQRWAVSDGKTTMPLEIAADLLKKRGGATKLTGATVKLSGKWSAVLDAILLNDLVLEADPGPPPVRPVPLVGTKKWLTVPCRFSDLSNPAPHTQSYFQDLMSNASPGVGDYFAKTSNGRLGIDSTVLDWQDMPFPASSYDLGLPTENIFGLMTDCLGQADFLVDYREFDGIQILFSHNIDSLLTGGPIELPLEGDFKKYGVSVLSPLEFSHQASVARGVGIALDMTFSGSAPLVLDSPWDVMSRGFGTANGVSCLSATSAFGCGAVLAAAEQSARSGWMDASQVASVGATAQQAISLDFLGNVPLPGHHSLVRLPIDTQHWYTIEAREQKLGTYDIGVPRTDVVIQYMDGTPVPDSPTDPQVLEASTRLRPVANLNGATSYVNDSLRLKLDVVPQAWGYQLTVTRGPQLSVTYHASDARVVSGSEINCGQGSYVCATNTTFGATVTLTAYPAAGKQVDGWTGCASVNGNTCTVTLDKSRNVNPRIIDRTEPEPGEDICVCPPTMPLYKCQQICGF